MFRTPIRDLATAQYLIARNKNKYLGARYAVASICLNEQELHNWPRRNRFLKIRLEQQIFLFHLYNLINPPYYLHNLVSLFNKHPRTIVRMTRAHQCFLTNYIVCHSCPIITKIDLVRYLDVVIDLILNFSYHIVTTANKVDQFT